MAEYINRDKLKRLILEDNAPWTVSMVIRHIDKCPAADVAPVRHGRWDDGSCTNCGWFGDCVDTPYYRYCPDCGVKMDLEE